MAYTLSQLWLPENQYSLKAPYAMTPVGIVAHNTAGSASARTEATNMINNSSATGFHAIVDESEAIECIPFSRNAFHAGDGANGFANRNLIGIEIARSMDYSDDKFDRAEENAIEYIAWVCVQYGWTSNEVNQHNWYSQTECPHRTKLHWQSFLDAIDAKIAQIKADANGHPSQPDPNQPTVDEEGKVKVALHGYERAIRGKNEDGTVYVSVRDLLSQMGYDVGWQDGKVTVEYKKNA